MIRQLQPGAELFSPLPGQPSPLIGRDREVADVVGMLLRPDIRLLTLTGTAGTGKTRLALHVADHLRGAFEDGVCFIDLSNVVNPALVIAAVAQGLRITEAWNRRLIDGVREALADRNILLVLDNFEQVLAASTTVSALLAACARLKVLTTSRTPLHLRWEHEYPVAPLEVPEIDVILAPQALAEFPSIALFVERTRAVRPEFALNVENATAVVELCRRLDGLPLAIELAAAKCKVFTPRVLLGRFSRGLDLLTTERGDVPVRQQTLRGAIAWSYALLSDADKLLFPRLAVFSGGLTTDIAQAFWTAAVKGTGDDSADDVLIDRMVSLVDNSLLQRTDNALHEIRFRMLETIRAFAWELLESSGELDQMRHHHASTYLAMVEALATFDDDQDIDCSSKPEMEKQARLEVETENFRTARAWFDAHDEMLAESLRLATALSQFWHARGYAAEGRAWLESLLDNETALSNVAVTVLAKAWSAVAMLAEFQGDYTSAHAHFSKGADIYRSLNAEKELAAALLSAGWTAGTLQAGDGQGRVNPLIDESLAIYRRLGDLNGESKVLNTLGEHARLRGDYEQAAAFYERCLALQGASNHEVAAGMTMHNLGYVAQHRGDATRAASLFVEALKIYREHNVLRSAAVCMSGLVSVTMEARPKEAASLYGAIQAWHEHSGASMQPPDRVEHEKGLAAFRQKLGESAFREAFDEGRRLPLATAIEIALESAAPFVSAEQGTSAPTAQSVLSRREQEVAALIAEGLTNRQIAERLVIAPRTADTHVANILTKLGFTSRSQIASWTANRALRN